MAASESTFLTNLKMDTKAQSKQRTREELLKSIPNSGESILKLHEDLQHLADDLDAKVEGKLTAHENAFFLAYKSHMYTVQKEFNDLKQKADEEETKTRRDAKIQSLEKELQWFMNEALRLDELCKKYKRELDKWKGKAEALEDDRQFLENQIKGAKKHNKTLRTSVEKAQSSAYAALVAAEDAPSTLQQPSGAEVEESREARSLPVLASGLSQELEDRYANAIRSLKTQLEAERRTAAKMRAVTERQFGEPSELESFFLTCIDRVKEDIFQRRRSATEQGGALKQSRKAVSTPALWASPSAVSTDEFTAADRRQVVELLLSSEQVLVFLYDKLFPHPQWQMDAAGGYPVQTMS